MVSIVIPVYNSGDFLRPCVDSIIAQTYNDWELLLVDDGSSDGSELACDEYAKKDVRIKVFHKSNQGATSARQFGVANARGEWVLFSDSDDILPAGSLEKLVSFADSSVDIVVVQFFTRTQMYYIHLSAKGKFHQVSTFACYWTTRHQSDLGQN